MADSKYEPAPTKEDEAKVAANMPVKGEETLYQKLAFYACWLGFAFILTGIICAFAMKPIVEAKILNNLPLVEESKAFSVWKDPVITPLYSVRIFNITNLDEFLSGRSKPKLQELGPYAYKEKQRKSRLNFKYEGRSIKYEVSKKFYFSAADSGGSEKDEIMVPNLPLLTVMEAMASEGQEARETFEALLKTMRFAKDTKPFIKMTVKEFLWGYDSVMTTLQKQKEAGCQPKVPAAQSQPVVDDWGFSMTTKAAAVREAAPTDDPVCSIRPGSLEKFGVLQGFNNTSMDPREVGTGVDELFDKGMFKAWYGKTDLPYWNDDYDCYSRCNTIHDARDPFTMPIGVSKKDDMKLFIGRICRSMQFRYVQEIMHDSFKTFRFAPAEDSFDNPKDTPAMGCYCLKEDENECFMSGVMDMSTCKPGTPVHVSWPHFLHGEPDLRRALEGMEPDPAKHRFYLDVHPKYGILLAAMARLQWNVVLRRDSGFSYFKDINTQQLIYPFMWVEEGLTDPTELVSSTLAEVLARPSRMQMTWSMGCMIIGLLVMVPEIFFWIQGCMCNKNTGAVEDEPEELMAMPAKEV